jgi:hypothetical protein
MKNPTLIKNMPHVKLDQIPLEEASSSSVKLYESSAIHGLLSDYREARFVACDDWSHIERVLINAPMDA